MAPSDPKLRALLGLVGTGAAAWLMSALPIQEGVYLFGYLDPLGIPTKCIGDTRDVVVGRKYTRAECNASLVSAIYDHSAPLFKRAPQLDAAPPSVRAATISAAFKSGTSSKLTAALLDRARAEDWPGLCRAILFSPVTGRRWFISGTDARTGERRMLAGLVKRADVEYSICVSDLGLTADQTEPIVRAAADDMLRIRKNLPAALREMGIEEGD